MRETLRYAGATHVGLIRTNNEDTYMLPESAVQGRIYFVLADGMGGHSRGELASQVAAAYAAERLQTAFASESDHDKDLDIKALLTDVMQKANVKVYLSSLENEDSLGMGTTMTLMVLDEENIWIAHVGDCRVYLYRDQSMIQLTVDQTVAQEMLDAGSLTPEELSGHPRRNVLTQALGIPEFIQPEIVQLPRQKNDRYLLCSDGLYGQVADDNIKTVLKKVKEPENAAQQLIQLALDHGGDDNVTVLVVYT